MTETEQKKIEDPPKPTTIPKTWVIVIAGIVLVILLVIVTMLWKSAGVFRGGKRKWGGRGGSCGCAAGLPPP